MKSFFRDATVIAVGIFLFMAASTLARIVLM